MILRFSIKSNFSIISIVVAYLLKLHFSLKKEFAPVAQMEERGSPKA